MAVVTSAVVGLAATATTTGLSFAQARKQRRLQEAAETKASQMMSEARKKLDVNFYEQLAIQKEPYELEREALISAGAQTIEAGRESERGVAATAGRVQMAQQQGQREIAAAMGQEMLGLDKLTAQEESRLRDVGVQLDLEEVAGAQMAAAQAAEAANMATQQGVQGIVSMGQQVAAMAPLYAKTPSARQASRIQKIASDQYGLSQSDIQQSIASLGSVNNIDLSKVSGMTPMQYMDFMSGLDVGTLKQIRQSLPTTLSSFRPAQYQLQSPSKLPNYLSPTGQPFQINPFFFQ